MDANAHFILQAVNISKSFPGVKALDGVSLNVEKGKVHAVMGENGAGKSTLMKVLIGMCSPDAGDLYFKGKKIVFNNVHEAIKNGFSMIHQELFPFLYLTIAQNIFMGNEPASGFMGWINQKKMNRDAALLLNRLGLNIPVTRQMKECSIAEMQMVEIAKAISNNAEIIIMDEPTSAITGREVEILFRIIDELRKDGIAIIYISHKMEEILRISDTITVLRDGKFIITTDRSAITNDQLINLIVGRQLKTVFDKRNITPGEQALSVSSLTGKGFNNISFDLRKGEILGFAGLMGSGRTEIVNAIFGLQKIFSGEIFVKGKRVRIKSPKDAIQLGIGLVTEDRKSFGLVLSSSVRHNITLAGLKHCSNGVFLNRSKEEDIVKHQIKTFEIKTRSGKQLVNLLSGGNQQKVVIAKVLLNNPDIVILDEPTRGIDVGAKAEIYKLIFRLAEEGKAIIMISSELPEILGMSDRIIVIREGMVKAEFGHVEATQELIMKYAMA